MQPKGYSYEQNLLREVNIGEVAKTELKKLKDAEKISDASYSSFCRRTKQLYRTGVSELLRTFPLKNSLLRYLQVFHPLTRNVHHQSKEAVEQVATRSRPSPEGRLTSCPMNGCATCQKKFQRNGIVILPRTLMRMMMMPSSLMRKKTPSTVTSW